MTFNNMKKKLTEQYVNRYKDVFTFTYDKKNNLILWEGDFKYCRYSWENDRSPDDNYYCMVDPSGGPYISSGMQSNFIIKEVTGFYVDYLSIKKGGGDDIKAVNIHLKPLKK